MEGAPSLSETAYARLKQRILSGELQANATVDEAQAAKEFGISRTPVREALLRLQSEGLVEIARGRGIRVTPLSATEMRNLYEAITGIETTAVFAAARRAPEESELAGIEQALEAMAAAALADDDEAWGHADESFHRELLRLSGDPFLAQSGLQLRDRAQRAHLVAARMQPPDYKQRSTANHAALLELIRAGQALKAANAHLRQRLRGEHALLSIFERFGLRVL